MLTPVQLHVDLAKVSKKKKKNGGIKVYKLGAASGPTTGILTTT